MSGPTPPGARGGLPQHQHAARPTEQRNHSSPVLTAAPLAGPGPLIDVHAHFAHAASGRPDWRALNAARLRAGERIGITCHVASILGSWGLTSPTYFASPRDVTRGNDEMLAIERAEGPRVRS